MEESNVQIVTLPPMLVASAWAFGPSPEEAAWKKLEDWAKPKGLLDVTGRQRPRLFGFNNPSPSVGSPNYGYEFWLTVDEGVEPEGDIRIVFFAGGLYALMPITVREPSEDIPAGWQRLDSWVHENGREMASHQWLEEHHLTCAGDLSALCYALKG
jgi:DNA gyrase inhibitor GyrI